MNSSSRAMAQNTNRFVLPCDDLETAAVEAMRLHSTVETVRWSIRRFGTEPAQLQSGATLLTGPAYAVWIQHFDRLDQIYS